MRYLDAKPLVPPSCFIAPGAHLIGKVTLGQNTSIWFNVVIRADIAAIEIGDHTNIQDGTIVHVDTGVPVKMGNFVSVGHNAIVHSAVVGDNALIGMGAILLSGCKIGQGALVAAGTLVKEGFEVPPKTLIAGVPGKVIRELTPEESEKLLRNAKDYDALREKYLSLPR